MSYQSNQDIIIIIVLVLVAFFSYQVGTQQHPTGLNTTITTSITVTSSGLSGNVTSQAQIVEYCFSPGGHCDQVLIKYIGMARTSIHIVIYSFTLPNVEQALVQAKSRGVDVKVVCDKHEWSVQPAQCPQGIADGLSVKKSSNNALTHDKFMIVDGTYVLEGSYNWSSNATISNDENLMVLKDSTTASSYEQQFQRIYNAGT